MRWCLTQRELIDIGALCDYEIAIPESDFVIDENDLPPGGDFTTKKMREASKRSHIVGDVVKEYTRRAFGKRAICFATDVETAGEIAKRFNDAGIPSAAVSGETPGEVRDDLVKRFKRGQIWVLVNVDLFGEGFDVPACEVVIMARPTASLSVYLQQFGRALRPMLGKAYGLIIDHVSNWKRHGYPDKPHYWTLDRRDKRAKREKDPEDIPLTVCRGCSRPYERCLPACPRCGWVPPLPEGGGRSIEEIDGDLMLLDRAKLAEMRKAIMLPSPADVGSRTAFVAGDFAAKGAVNRQIERVQAQQKLDAAIAQWAGIQRHKGRSDQESYRRFFLTTGVDVLTALSLPRSDMEALASKVEGWYNA
jgi:DNA repair protein RadD